jgi:hypothetical protein
MILGDRKYVIGGELTYYILYLFRIILPQV